MGDKVGEITSCTGKKCGFNVSRAGVGCSSGDGGCLDAKFLIADASDFHDSQLIRATGDIKNIIAGLRAPAGKTLAFLNTDFGILLAWVEHGMAVPDDAVTDKDPAEAIAKALGLKLDDESEQSAALAS
jgi:hypothetical protein